MSMKFKNNASSKLATSLTAEATTLKVIADTGSNFPSIVSPKEYFHATLVGDNGDMEIIRVTNISGDTFTVVRAQEDTVAKEWPAGTRLENRITAEFLNQVATGDTIKFDQVTIKTDSEGVSSVDPAEVYPPASSTELGVVKVDEETITISEDNAISVLPSGIIDNNTIVLDENGKLTSKSIPYSKAEQQIFSTSTFNIQTVESEFLVLPWPEAINQSGTLLFSRSSSGNLVATKQGIYHISIELALYPRDSLMKEDGWIYLYKNDQQYNCGTFKINGQDNNPDVYNFSADIPFEVGDEFIIKYTFPMQSGSIQVHYLRANILRYPVTNEYQISDSEINDYFVGGHSGSVLVQVYERQDSTYDVGEFQDIDFKYSGRKFTEKLSDGTVKILEDGLYFFQLEVAVDTSSDTGAVPYDYQIGIQAKMQSLPSEEWAKLCTNTISVESQILNPDVSQSSIVRRLSAGDIIRPYIYSGVTLTFSIFHSDLQIVKFPSLVDAPNSGEVGILPFTPPTASEPGEAGLVPGPQATDPLVQLSNILTMKGWAGFDPAAIMPSITGDGTNTLGLGAESAEGVNIDTLLRTGIFTATNLGGTLPDNTPGGVLINLFSSAPDSKYYGQQLLFTLGGNAWYRANAGIGISPGGTPVWSPWYALSAPRPQAAEGVGQWTRYGAMGGTIFQLPEEGVWAYSVIKRNLTTNGVLDVYGGVAAGGTIIDSQSSATIDYVGLAWQVSA